MPSYKATIKVNRLDKSAFFKGKNGDTYCSVILWENRDGADDYGNTHSIKQDLGKDRKGEKSDYVGNAKPIGGDFGQPNQHSRAGRDVPANEARYKQSQGTTNAKGPVTDNGADDDDDSSIPF